MNFHVLTLFPEMVSNGLNTSILGRATDKGLLSFDVINIRDYTLERHGKVDDYPYGGGAGMVMQAEPIYRAYEALVEKIGHKPRVVYMTPQGQVFNQKIAEDLEVIGICISGQGLSGECNGLDKFSTHLITQQSFQYYKLLLFQSDHRNRM